YRRLRGDLILTYALFEQGLANRFFTVDPANTRRGHGERQLLNDKNKTDPGNLGKSLAPAYQSLRVRIFQIFLMHDFMSMDAARPVDAEAGACKSGSVHYRMSKKIAHLTKVIYMLNCKKEDVDILLRELQVLHKEEILELQRASEAKLKKYRALAKESYESNLKQSQLSSNMESLQEKLKLQKEFSGDLDGNLSDLFGLEPSGSSQLYDRRILEMTFEQKKTEEADEIKIRLLEKSLQEATTELALCQHKLEDANMTLNSHSSVAMDTLLLENDGLKLQLEEVLRLNEELMREKEVTQLRVSYVGNQKNICGFSASNADQTLTFEKTNVVEYWFLYYEPA
ncbi:hypothetical protein CLF_113227, partial [Clonorchis sinensis]